MQASNLDYDRLSASTGVKGGKLSLSTSLNSQGNSFRKIAENLSGQLDLKLTDTILTSGGLFYSTSNLFDILNPLSKGKKETEIKCLLTKFNINKGLADSSGTSAKIEDLAVLGDGTIDLRNETVSMGFVPRSSSIGAATLVPPLKVYGSLKNPSILPNPLRLAAEQIDNIQGLITGTIGLAGDLLVGIAEATTIISKPAPKAHHPGQECEEIIKENSDKLTTLVGSLVFGKTPAPQNINSR